MPDQTKARPLYDSRCLTDEHWLRIQRRMIYNPMGWEWRFAPSEQRVYLRRHMSGPVSTDMEGWNNA